MNYRKATRNLTIAALLCAIGIVIPLFSPVKILLEPASFTLASHVSIFLAMFISPLIAVTVAIGTTLGFFLGGFPIVIVMRALTHCIFAFVGAKVLSRRPEIMKSPAKALTFSFLISLLHAACEVLVVIPFYFGNTMAPGYYQSGFFTSVVLLVGVGGVVHSMIDFWIAFMVWKPIQKVLQKSA